MLTPQDVRSVQFEKNLRGYRPEDVDRFLDKVEEQLQEDDAQAEQLRKQIAEREHTPAYIIFSDDALEDMVQKKPVTLDEFSEIRGVGRLKLDKYGKVFVALIRFVLRLPKKEL